MTRFCVNCGLHLPDTAIFCGGCGAKIPAAADVPMQPATDPASRAQVPATAGPPPPAASDPASWATVALPVTVPPPADSDPAAWAQVPKTSLPPAANVPAPIGYISANAYPGKKSNTLVKVVIAIVVLICVGSVLALTAIYYTARKLTQKAHQAAAEVLGQSSVSTGDDRGSGFKGDPCRFLSKTEVSQAIGLTVICTEAKDEGCSYIAKGDPADVTAKHASAMLGGFGADAQAQKTLQKFAGAIFAQQEASDKGLAAEAATGEVTVLLISFTSGNAQMEMKLNRGAFDRITSGPPSMREQANAQNTGTGDLAGIGDESYVAGGSMLMVRKGNTVAHFTYISCPCNTDNIKPLARTVASRL
jgi:zinc-ribbon domain